jgi:DNA gyrase subunit A
MIIEAELDEIRTKFANPRRTQFIEEQEDLTTEDLIAEEEMVVTVTYSGYIKRLPVDTYRAQKRGGKGVMGAGTKAEDFIWDIFVASTLDHILCFTDQGRVYWLKVYKIPEAGRTAKGKPIVNLLNLSTNERVQSVLPIKEFKENWFVTMVTKNGTIKKTSLEAFSRPMKKGIIALTTDEGDTLVDAKVTQGNQHVVLVSKEGQSIRFEETDVRAMGRNARGVAGMKLDTTDEVIGMAIVEAESQKEQLLTVTQNGYGKRTFMEEYRPQGRGGSGIMTMKITEKNGPIVAVRKVADEDDIIIASDKGKVIRTRVSEISEVGRIAQGVRLINLEEGEKVAAVAKLDKEEESSSPAPVTSDPAPSSTGNA